MTDRPRTVLFVDLDGTIIRGPFEGAVFPVLVGELAGATGLPPGELRQLVLQEYLGRQCDPHVPPVRAVDWDDIFATVAGRLGVRLQTSALEIVRSCAGPPHAAILEGADAVLGQLSSAHRALVVATRGLARYQRPVLDALGLTPLFADILTPDTHQALKRSLAFYGPWPRLTALQISVGDQYEDDVLAPRSFGFRAVWKPEGAHPALGELAPCARPAAYPYAPDQPLRPDAIILSLAELPAVVERLEGEAFAAGA